MNLKYAPLIAVAIFALAGFGSISAYSPAASGSSAAVQAAPPSPDCHSAAVSWRDSGGSTQLDAFTADLTAVQKADFALANGLGASGDLSTAEGDLQSAAASLQSDAQAAEANLPPRASRASGPITGPRSPITRRWRPIARTR